METEKMAGKMGEGATKPRIFLQSVVAANISLVIQFLFGMYINLYVKFPTGGPAEYWKFAWHTWPVVFHILLGTLILLLSINSLAHAIRLKNRHWIKFFSLGVAAMLLAVIGGETFITTQNELASYLMALGFLAGIMTLNWGLYTE